MLSNHDLPPLLIAEDDPDDLFFARLLVQRADIHNPVVTVEDGEEAVVYLSGAIETQRLPCLALLDIKMPILTGFGVLEWARQQPALAEFPFVMMSGSDMEEDKARAKALGAKHYLVKYPSPTDLGAIVRAYCRAC